MTKKLLEMKVICLLKALKMYGKFVINPTEFISQF